MIAFRKSASGVVMGLLSLTACGEGSSSPGTGTVRDQASSSLTLTLSSAGVSPKTSSVSGNGSVTITNGDDVAHQLASNPDPQQTDCPELNSPVLAPGDQFTVIVANRNGTCGFNDSLNPTDSNFQGTITVTTASPNPSGAGSGGGY